MNRIYNISILLFVFILLLTGCQQKNPETNEIPALSKIKNTDQLFRIEKNNMVGFINSTGRIVIEPKFYQCDEFNADIIPAAIIESTRNISTCKYGYINSKGDFIIKPKFEEARPFCEGLAVVKENGKYGFVDKMGNIVIKPSFSNACDFF
jgi:hypothetical protein